MMHASARPARLGPALARDEDRKNHGRRQRFVCKFEGRNDDMVITILEAERYNLFTR